MYHSTIESLVDGVKLLQQRAKQDDEDDFLRLEVQRSHLLKDAFREAKKKKFNPEKMIKVQFLVTWFTA